MFAFAGVSLVGREARVRPFIVKVCSPPPSQSKPWKANVYWLDEGVLIETNLEAVAVFALASVPVRLTV
jgi:hypothetical protein